VAPRIEMKGLFFVYLALSLLFVPVKWFVSWIAAAIFHELCHLLALRCFRCKIVGIKIGITGAVITSAPATNVAALICEAAGPVGSMLLLLLSRIAPTVAICGFIQGVFNLLPLYPLDGSKILDRFLSLLLSEKHRCITMRVIRYVTVSVLLICGVFLYQMSLGPIPLLIVLILSWNSRKNSLQK